MLNRILNQALDQYVLDRVDQILRIAGAADAEYRKAVKEADTVLSQLLTIAHDLETQNPELLRLVREYESATSLESCLATEIIYREGIRDSCSIGQELGTLMQKQTQDHKPFTDFL